MKEKKKWDRITISTTEYDDDHHHGQTVSLGLGLLVIYDSRTCSLLPGRSPLDVTRILMSTNIPNNNNEHKHKQTENIII